MEFLAALSTPAKYVVMEYQANPTLPSFLPFFPPCALIVKMSSTRRSYQKPSRWVLVVVYPRQRI